MDLKAFDQETKSKKKIIIIASVFLIVAIAFVAVSYSLFQKQDEGIVADGTVKRGTSVLKATSSSDNTAFRSSTYKDKIKNITIEDEINIRDNKIEQWDISEAEDESIIAYVVPNETEGYYDLYIQSNNYIEANSDMSYWFANFFNLDNINGLDLVDTNKVTNMERMFFYTGRYSTIFTLDLGDNFDTSNVTSMWGMFYYTGYSNPNFTLDLGDNFDTSKVTNMRGMFNKTGYNSAIFTLDLGDKFDTSNVTDMESMFNGVGCRNTNFTLNLKDKFDTSKVTNMQWMFQETGRYSTVFTLDLGDKFDTSNVGVMSYMFDYTGYSNPNFTLDLGDKFDTGKVYATNQMFYYTGYNSTKLNVTITIRHTISYFSNYTRMFEGVATKTGSQITVNYTTETSDLVDQMIATKSTNSNVVKGVQVD